MAEIPVKVTGDSRDAVKALSDTDKALLSLIESEKRLAASNAAKAKFEAMTQAEKDAFVAATKLDDGLDKLGDTTKKTGDGFKIAGLTATDMVSIFDKASQAAKIVYEKLEAVVSETVAYAEEVRDLGRISGTSAEETSRLIQTADDLKVSYDTLTQAAKALAKDGLALTTEELAKASDEYLAISDAGARAEYATTRFGRAGLELTKVLETGGDALRQMAKEQSGGLVLTQKQVDAARELEKAQDELGDSFDALKTALGNGVIPELTKLIKFTTDYVFWAEKTKNAVLAVSDTYPQYLERMKEEIKLRSQSNVLLNILKTQMPGIAALMEIETQKGVALSEVQFKLAKGYYNIADEGTRAAAAAKLYARDVEAAAEASKALALSDLALALQNEEGAFYDTGSAAVDYNSKIALTGDAVNALIAKYGSLNNAQLYNILVQGMDGDAAIELGIKMGILSPQVMAARDAADGLNKKFQSGAIDAATYAGQADALAAAIAKLNDKSITITTYFNNVGQRMTPEQQAANNPNNPNGPGQSGGPPVIDRSGVIYYNAPVAPDNPDRPDKYAQGGTYTIPPGYNESWPVGPNAVASSGETVTITPPGKGGAGATYHINLNFYGPTNAKQAEQGVLAGMRAAGKL